MNQSEQINEISAALAKAQGEILHASKDSTNPHFKSKYADLAAVWQACREPLSKHGLAVTQVLDFVGDKQVLVTTLSHTSGQWIKSTIALPIVRPGPQEMGSCISYCRRYSLAAMVGVYQDDDDANNAQKPYNNAEIKVERAIDKSQIAIIDSFLNDIEDDKYLEKIFKHLNVNDISEIKQKDYDKIVKSLERKSKEKSNAESTVA